MDTDMRWMELTNESGTIELQKKKIAEEVFREYYVSLYNKDKPISEMTSYEKGMYKQTLILTQMIMEKLDKPMFCFNASTNKISVINTSREIDEEKVKRIIGKYLKYVKPENNKGIIVLTSTNNTAHEIATSDIFKEEKMTQEEEIAKDAIHVLQLMIKSYEERGGGHFQKEALKLAIQALETQSKISISKID